MSAMLRYWVPAHKSVRVRVKKRSGTAHEPWHFIAKIGSYRKPNEAGSIVPFVKIRNSMERFGHLKTVTQPVRNSTFFSTKMLPEARQ